MNADTYSYTKPNVSHQEYRIYKYLANAKFPYIPKLYSYDKVNNLLRTQRINGCCVADYYGDCYKDLPTDIKKAIKEIITDLYSRGIIYPDITGYNFIRDYKNKIWIVDFEHSFCVNNYKQGFIEDDSDILDYKEHIQFVKGFCFHNNNNWNPYFA